MSQYRKEVKAVLKLRINAGEANNNQSIGAILSQLGINMMEFCKSFNEKTAHLQKSVLLPVTITLYTDLSYEFRAKLPSNSFFLKKALCIEVANKGYTPFDEKTSKSKKRQIDRENRKYYQYLLTQQQLFEISLIKCFSFPYMLHLSKICNMLLGSSHSMRTTVRQHNSTFV
uniref:Ribosomal protein L11 n=1 Tax=Eukaryota sp. BB2 TaxID=1949062 RepID=A0A1W5QGC6_9EUKA|nr:ribosomal protein L11 [Eukaryota sp. BB2]AQL10460.1 ribosomal protein L11 [Eukaryota sp. BB2]